MQQYSKRLTWLKNTKPGMKLEVWHHPLCAKEYHVVATTPEGEMRQDFQTELKARVTFDKLSEEMAK